MQTQVINNRLKTKLNQVFKRQSFLDKISEQRRKIGIPKNAFTDYEEWRKWLKKRKNSHNIFVNKIWDFSIKLAPEFGLSFNDAFWVESFLLFGENYFLNRAGVPLKETGFTQGFDVEPDFNCSLEFDRDDIGSVNVKISPNASKREVSSYIAHNWWFIKSVQGLAKKQKLLRERRVTTRNEEIYQLYKARLITCYGICKDVVPDYIQKLDKDYLRKIISKEKADRK